MSSIVISDSLRSRVTQVAVASVKKSQGAVDKALAKSRAQVEKLAMEYYKGTVKTVEQTLMNPRMTHFEAGGPWSRKASVAGESVVLSSTGSWAPLSQKYIRRRPPSKTYWRKTGALWSAFRIRANSMNLDRLSVYSRGKLTRLPDSRYLAKASFPITFPAVPGSDQADVLIRRSFVKRALFRQDARSLGHLPAINHLAQSEATRPWISKFAKDMGERFLKRLESLEK